MAITDDWMEVDGRLFKRNSRYWWTAEDDPKIYVYEVTWHPYVGSPPRTYWEASRTKAAPTCDILAKSRDLEECCWDAVQAVKNINQETEELCGHS